MTYTVHKRQVPRGLFPDCVYHCKSLVCLSVQLLTYCFCRANFVAIAYMYKSKSLVLTSTRSSLNQDSTVKKVSCEAIHLQNANHPVCLENISSKDVLTNIGENIISQEKKYLNVLFIIDTH